MPERIRLPGQFMNWFSGSDVMQHPYDSVVATAAKVDGADSLGYPGAPALRRAIDAADISKVYGKSSSYLLTFDVDGQDLIDALDCLDSYADTCAEGALQMRSEYRASEIEYREADRELQAARAVRTRVARIRTELVPG